MQQSMHIVGFIMEPRGRAELDSDKILTSFSQDSDKLLRIHTSFSQRLHATHASRMLLLHSSMLGIEQRASAEESESEQ